MRWAPEDRLRIEAERRRQREDAERLQAEREGVLAEMSATPAGKRGAAAYKALVDVYRSLTRQIEHATGKAEFDRQSALLADLEARKGDEEETKKLSAPAAFGGPSFWKREPEVKTSFWSGQGGREDDSASSELIFETDEAG